MLEVEFLEAVVKGDSQRVVRLLGQINDSGPVKDGRNALHLAAQYGNADIVSILLLSGLYDCKTTDAIGFTALQIAAAEGYLEIVKQLIKAGSDINAADNVHGNTALHEAAWKGYSRTVAELAKAKANLNITNWGGFTALHLCCQNGHNQCCRELLLAGCDPDVQNNYGDTPLHTTARYGHAGVMRILISARCHVSDQNKNGDTALHIAAAMNRRKLTRILLESNCNKNVVNKQNETAEDIALRKSHSEILEILKSSSTAAKKAKHNSAEPTKSGKTETKNVNKRSEEARASIKKKKVQHPRNEKMLVPWSPYGCHYYPDSAEFPEPNLDSLPADPLRKGEQYYLDLAGNIRKGPVGVGYACYCAPFFHELENCIEKKTKKIKKQIYQTQDALNKRLDTIEYCLSGQYRPKVENGRSSPDIFNNGLVSHAQSFESVFDLKCREEGETVKQRSNADRFEKRKNIAFLKETQKHDVVKEQCSECSIPNCQANLTNLNESHCRKTFYSSGSLDNVHASLWKTSELRDGDSCESSDEDEKITDIPCNDSGYSTKMCSNSQGPSPSLSGRLESDGLFSIISPLEEKHNVENSFMKIFKNMSVKQTSIV